MENGFVVTVIGLLLIFSTLSLLFVVFQYGMPLLLKLTEKKDKAPVTKEESAEVVSDSSGEIKAVIAAAIYQYMEEAHDEEQAILTIQQVQKAYSPWSSKIYSVHNSNVGLKNSRK